MATQTIGLSAQVATATFTQTINSGYIGIGSPLSYTSPTSSLTLVNVGAGGAQYRIDNGVWLVLDKNEGNSIPVDLSINRVSVKLINDGSASTKLECMVESLPTAYIGPSGEIFPVANPPVTVTGYRYSGSVATAVPGTSYAFTAGQWYRNGAAISGQTALTYTRTDTDIGTALTFIPTGMTYSGAGGTTLSSEGYSLRQVATGTFINDAQHGSNKQANIRSPHYMRDSVSQIQIVLPNWYVVSQTETNGTGADTWRAAIEYPVGVFTQVTFAGSVSGVASVGANLISDPVAAPPNGEKFWVRLFLSSAGLIKFFQYYAGDGTAQAEYAVSGLTDKTLGGSIATVGSVGAAFIMPCAIIAVSAVPAVAIVGDSISVGRGDSDGVGRALQGHYGRSYGAVYPAGHVGVSGDRIQAYLASNSKRTALVNNYFTHVAFNMGINDVSSGRTAVQIEADTNTMLNLYGTRPKDVSTLGPVSTSTDAWVTVVNQTASAATPNAVRSVVNTQRITTLPLAKVLTDVNPVVENTVSPEDSIWNVTGGANTNDGTHHNANSAGRIAAAINTSALVS